MSRRAPKDRTLRLRMFHDMSSSDEEGAPVPKRSNTAPCPPPPPGGGSGEVSSPDPRYEETAPNFEHATRPLRWDTMPIPDRFAHREQACRELLFLFDQLPMAFLNAIDGLVMATRAEPAAAELVASPGDCAFAQEFVRESFYDEPGYACPRHISPLVEMLFSQIADPVGDTPPSDTTMHVLDQFGMCVHETDLNERAVWVLSFSDLHKFLLIALAPEVEFCACYTRAYKRAMVEWCDILAIVHARRQVDILGDILNAARQGKVVTFDACLPTDVECSSRLYSLAWNDRLPVHWIDLIFSATTHPRAHGYVALAAAHPGSLTTFERDAFPINRVIETDNVDVPWVERALKWLVRIVETWDDAAIRERATCHFVPSVYGGRMYAMAREIEEGMMDMDMASQSSVEDASKTYPAIAEVMHLIGGPEHFAGAFETTLRDLLACREDIALARREIVESAHAALD